MKFAKKIFVGILAVALMVSCFALSTSAEAPVFPTENLEDVLEYRLYDTYIVETYDGYAEGVYPPASSDEKTESDSDAFCNFVGNDVSSAKVIADGENKLLEIVNKNSKGVGYKFYTENSDDFIDMSVTSFDFRLGDALGANSSDLSFVVTLNDYFEEITLFTAKTLGQNKVFEYSEYNSDRVTYSTVTSQASAEAGKWYHVDVVYDLRNGMYSVSVTSSGAEVFSFRDEVSASVGIDSFRIYVSGADAAADAEPVEAKAYIDNFAIYEGSAVRNVIDPENALADLIIAIDAYAKDKETGLDARLELVGLYLKLYEGEEYGIKYTAPEGIKEYAKVDAIVKDAKAYINRTYADALIEYSSNILDAGGYYERIDYRDTYAKKYYDMFPSTLDAIKAIAGMTDVYGEDSTYAQAVLAAKETYDKACYVINETKLYSEDFAKELENGYDPANTNYKTMLDKYSRLSLVISKVDSSYRYSDVVKDTKYPTLADAIAEYKALENKIAEINANVSVFVPAVNAMDMTQNQAVSANSPYLTENFETLYENYLIASSVYENGTVHPQLDPATYDGLAEVILAYEAAKDYVDARVLECNEFIAIIKGANASTYYVTVKQQLESASAYLDSDKEKSLEKYEGVDEAIALYSEIVKRLEKNVSDANAYIASVAKIDMNASYSALRAAVNEALALQAAGSVTGIDGVKEANINLAKAEAKVSALEGYSKTLIDAVNALKSATTLSERREYIFIANMAKDNAEDTISGVTAAKSELAKQIESYNADVTAVNALFAGVVSNVVVSASSVVPTQSVANVAQAVASALK